MCVYAMNAFLFFQLKVFVRTWPHPVMRSLGGMSLEFFAAWWLFEKKIPKSCFSLLVGFLSFGGGSSLTICMSLLLIISVIFSGLNLSLCCVRFFCGYELTWPWGSLCRERPSGGEAGPGWELLVETRVPLSPPPAPAPLPAAPEPPTSKTVAQNNWASGQTSHPMEASKQAHKPSGGPRSSGCSQLTNWVSCELFLPFLIDRGPFYGLARGLCRTGLPVPLRSVRIRLMLCWVIYRCLWGWAELQGCWSLVLPPGSSLMSFYPLLRARPWSLHPFPWNCPSFPHFCPFVLRLFWCSVVRRHDYNCHIVLIYRYTMLALIAGNKCRVCFKNAVSTATPVFLWLLFAWCISWSFCIRPVGVFELRVYLSRTANGETLLF